MLVASPCPAALLSLLPSENRMPRPSLAALCLAAMPLAATAQSFQLSSPSIGDALRQMDRMHQSADRRGLAEPGSDLAQTFVLPERPGQNQVAWYEFAWHHHDVPSPNGGQGGVRLYYYAREREVAEDRKSTRLNSSHPSISYAVFCL